MWGKCTSLIILSCAEPHPRPSRESVAQLLRVHYNFRQAADRGGAYRTSSLSLRRVRCRRRHCGPALVKTRSRELVRVNRDAFRHSRAGRDDNTLGRVRPHGSGSCGNSEQSDSHEPGNRSMSRHADLLLWSKRPLVLGHGNLREGSTAMRQVWIARIHRLTTKLSEIR